MCTKFQVDWTSTSSKTTSTKNFNLKRDRRTDAQTRKHNAHNWGIKMFVGTRMSFLSFQNTPRRHIFIKHVYPAILLYLYLPNKAKCQ